MQRGERRSVGPDDPVEVLRLSVTDRCNFRCRYCMPPGGVPKLRHEELLSLERLADTATWLCRELRIPKIKLSGGEPFVRGGIVDLVRNLAATAGVDEVSATTNGTALAKLARPLRAAGLRRVNISIDSLDSDRFAHLTRGGRLQDTVTGVDAAVAARLVPVKLNTVLLASSWRADVPALLDFAQERNLEVRFIELMRTGTEMGWAEREFVPAEEVQHWLGMDGEVDDAHVGSSGPARSREIRWNGAPLRVGWITPRTIPFCGSCNRLRLDARGRLRRCLMDPVYLDLVNDLRLRGESEARRALKAYLAGKKPSTAMESALPMISVGG